MPRILKKDKLPDSACKEMADKYKSGMSLKQVGDIFHVSEYVVKTVLMREGVEVRTSVESRRISVKPLPEDWLDMARLQAQGLTYEKIAELNFCSVSCVKNRLRKIRERGIKI